MPLWFTLRRWIHANLSQLNGKNLLTIFVLYILIGWVLLSLAGEEQLIHPLSNYIYYLVVTASTVGYGDLSPSTEMGRWVVSLFVIPVGLGIFALLLSRLANVLIYYWRAAILGKRKVKLENHILILGWNGPKTFHLIRMLQHEEKGKREIVLCTRDEMDNPLPGEIEFVHVSSYTHKDMQNTNLSKASCIIIDTREDDITLSSALYCSGVAPQAHTLVYFSSEELVGILNKHCPNVECIPAVSAEMLAKSAVDPGSSALHHELLSTTKGMTQYSVIYPDYKQQTNIGHLFLLFKEQYQAILIAIDSGNGIEINPNLSRAVQPNDKLFYIADERIDSFNWGSM